MQAFFVPPCVRTVFIEMPVDAEAAITELFVQADGRTVIAPDFQAQACRAAPTRSTLGGGEQRPAKAAPARRTSDGDRIHACVGAAAPEKDDGFAEQGRSIGCDENPCASTAQMVPVLPPRQVIGRE